MSQKPQLSNRTRGALICGPNFTCLKNNEQNNRQAILSLVAKLTPFGHRFGPHMSLHENNGAGRQHPSISRREGLF